VWSILSLEAQDPAPAYVQLARRLRVAIADAVLAPGDRLPSVRDLAQRLGVSTNTVARAYADLAREGVILARAGGGSVVAPRDALDRPALAKHREERLQILARQVAVRGLALGFAPSEIARAVARELARHGQPVPAEAPTGTLGGDEAALLSARNRLAGRVVQIRLGEMLAEVTLSLAAEQQLVVAVTRTSVERLGVQEGGSAAAYVKATEPILSA
jgi:GntR family transcriptional regulator